MSMRRAFYKQYLIIGAAIFVLLSLPAFLVENVRGHTIGALSIFFRSALRFKKHNDLECERLEGENHLLRIEIGKLRALLDQQMKIDLVHDEMHHQNLSAKRFEELKFLACMHNQAVPARVIYRDPASWSSSLWINVGEETNHILNRKVIQKNSPVILGRSVVGVVDCVGKKQSRVRLITDMAITPSVRAVRGFPQNTALMEHIEPLLRHLNGRSDLAFSLEDKTVLIKGLERLKQKLLENCEGRYLAKGILKGGGAPLWRSTNHILKGIGYNYDFADDEGPARELATGKVLNPAVSEGTACPIIKENDLLVTTGLDGVFPPGLRVAEVTKIYPLREGAYTYEIEATPVVSNLDTLQTVFIIPPLGFNIEDQ